MTLDEIIIKRKSVRKYLPTPVEEEKLLAVLEAGRLAPSARNRQTWRFTVVKNEETRKALQAACYDQPFVSQAPVNLVVWAGEDRTMQCGLSAAVVDCSIALSFMMLKATELDLGTCWLGIFEPEKVKEVLQLPAEAVVVAVTPLGYSERWPYGPGREELETIIDIRE